MNDLSCYCDSDVECSIYRASIVRARKAHRCEECAGKILPGEQYEYLFAIWDGNPTSMYTCSRCVDVRTWVRNNVPCFCFMHGGLYETAKDAIEDAIGRAPTETVGLRFGAIRRMLAIKRHNESARASA